MNSLLLNLLEDEAGFILSAELIVIATVLVLGMTTALVAVRDSVTAELTDVAGSLRNLDQSYYYSGIRGCRKGNTFSSWTAGSAFNDAYLRTNGPVQDLCGHDIILGSEAPAPGSCKPLCPTAPISITPPANCSRPARVQQGPFLLSPLQGQASRSQPGAIYYPQSVNQHAETVLPMQAPCPSSAPCGKKARQSQQLPKLPQGPLQVW
jgi:hypothetical protein